MKTERGTKENLRTIFKMGEGLWSCLTSRYMKESFAKVKWGATAFYEASNKRRYSAAAGLTIVRVASVGKLWKTGPSMRVTMRKTSSRAMESIFGLTDPNMRVILWETWCMERARTLQHAVDNTKAGSKTTNSTVMGLWLGPTVSVT